jgi:hypothetical protein
MEIQTANAGRNRSVSYSSTLCHVKRLHFTYEKTLYVMETFLYVCLEGIKVLSIMLVTPGSSPVHCNFSFLRTSY